jgi:hypothetical protein
VVITVLSLMPLSAQDGFAQQSFGFGFDDEGASGGGGGSALAVSIGGEVNTSVMGFYNDIADGAAVPFSGKFNLSAESSSVDLILNLKFQPWLNSGQTVLDSPITFDEAYARAYFGKFDIEGGWRKLAWGKADSMGPLDVINPLDYSDFSAISDPASLKIARPLVHLSYRFGSFSKIEGVVVSSFEPARFAETGRWALGQMARLTQLAAAGVAVHKPDTTAYNYAQGGARFTTTIANAADIGVQYYYGRLTRPAVTMTFGPPAPPLPPMPMAINFAYNPYHHIGLDYAQVLAGFNIRAEFAANITEDLNGDDPAVYNPSLAWSLGFDRDLFWGISLNMQCNETIRLLDGSINKPLDIEAGTRVTSTTVIAALSKKFLRDELEISAALMWEAEPKDFLFMPSLIWTKDPVSLELSSGIFGLTSQVWGGGDENGQFAQYRDNSFVRVTMKYTF